MRTTKSLFVICAFASFIFAAAPANIFAQERSATLEETLEFIANKVNVYGKNILWGGDAPAEVSFSSEGKCRVRVTTNFYQSNNAAINGGINRTFTHTFSLADIDPLAIEQGKGNSIYDPALEFTRIVLHTSDSQKKIEWRDTLDKRIKNTADVIIIVRAPGATDGLVQAFKRAVRLCGSKEDSSRLVAPKK